MHLSDPRADNRRRTNAGCGGLSLTFGDRHRVARPAPLRRKSIAIPGLPSAHQLQNSGELISANQAQNYILEMFR